MAVVGRLVGSRRRRAGTCTVVTAGHNIVESPKKPGEHRRISSPDNESALDL
jgi:hypothetical protein